MYDIQILIAAYGPDALERIAALPHPEFPGVGYVISWQGYDRERVPESLLKRDDLKLHYEDSKGLCNNRNALMRLATADIVVISDDDLYYTRTHLENIMKGVETYPDCSLLAFRYKSESRQKKYPAKAFNLRRPPRGYFVTSMEMVFNLREIGKNGDLKDVWFNPAFGVNGETFGSGEEEILVERMLRKGHKAGYIPLDICVNTDSTTGDRDGNTSGFIQTKGATLSYIKPLTWPLRMLTHALRAQFSRGSRRINFFRYCNWWLKGVRTAGKNKVFKDY